MGWGLIGGVVMAGFAVRAVVHAVRDRDNRSVWTKEAMLYGVIALLFAGAIAFQATPIVMK